MIDSGTIIKDKYEIESVLGVGGMANVYRAKDMTTNAVVAIKVLKDEYRNNAEFKLRFEREARAGLTLSHKNIVKPLDYGDFDGSKYIVFEYIDGYTLKDLIKQSAPLQPKTAINIIQQVLFALEHAHEKGIIHRDVKPQNVMITSGGVVKLADFGIARVTAASTKTFGGANVMGSVHYISPEQVRGDGVTEKSDLYSVGIMLYEMLTGTVPFDSDNQISVAVKHLNTPIKPPMEINSKIYPALNDVILKSTVKNPKLRYSSVADLRSDLERALREPDGEFAKMDIPLEETQYKASNVNNGVKRLAIVLSSILVFCVVLFIIISVTYNAKHLYVPNLIGKTYSEAAEIVGEDFKLSIIKSEENDEYPSGSIIAQDPLWKNRALAGSIIEVTLSLD
ncbi:MAG: serine/threonine protein kinase, partial [Clostridiales bacterium]|nr:serine/threonine protein kinase [Clostridiales bacterium]